MISKLLILVVILNCNILKSSSFSTDGLKENDETLLAVAVVYRHGDRAPLESFPNDKFFNRTYWPMGFGQLTQAGINRQYRLGQWFRQRYNKFLNEIYSPEEIYIYSTNVDRALSSAYAVLAGLYPPKKFQVWNEDINWQPIPVHTEDQSKDDIIVDRRVCLKYEKEIRKVREKLYPSIEKKYSEVFEYICNHTGFNHLTVDRIKKLYGTFKAYQAYNASFIPEWATLIDPDVFKHLAGLGFDILTHTPTLARLCNGPFFYQLFQHFDNFVIPPSDPKPKFFMISAHDVTLSAILGAMEAYKLQPINYSDTILWELRKKKTGGGYFINIYYKSGNKLEHLNIGGCGFNCNYLEFKRYMSNITINVQDWMMECDSE